MAAAAIGPNDDEASRILTFAQIAFGHLRGLLALVDDDLLDRAPAAGEWSIRQTLAHAIEVERSYRANTQHALVRGDHEPLKLSAERRPKPDPTDTSGGILDIVAAFAARRAETDQALAGLDERQLSGRRSGGRMTCRIRSTSAFACTVSHRISSSTPCRSRRPPCRSGSRSTILAPWCARSARCAARTNGARHARCSTHLTRRCSRGRAPSGPSHGHERRLRFRLGEWSNGSLESFRSSCSKEREGSSPSSPTERVSSRQGDTGQ